MIFPTRYRRLDEISTDPGGTLYRGRHNITGRDVVVRCLSDALDGAERTRLIEAVRRVARLSHRAIVAIIDADFDGTPAYVVFDAPGGTTLAEWIDRENSNASGRIRRALSDVAAALGFAHSHGVTHGGLCPERILVDHDGSARLSDFAAILSRPTPAARARLVDPAVAAYLPPSVLRDASAYDASVERRAFGRLVVHALTSSPDAHAESLQGDDPAIAEALVALIQDGTTRALERVASALSSQGTVDGATLPSQARQAAKPTEEAPSDKTPIGIDAAANNDDAAPRTRDGAEQVAPESLKDTPATRNGTNGSHGHARSTAATPASERGVQPTVPAVDASDVESRVLSKLERYAHLFAQGEDDGSSDSSR